jgi:hypothetical protein
MELLKFILFYDTSSTNIAQRMINQKQNQSTLFHLWITAETQYTNMFK